MISDEHGYFTDILVILIFLYLSGSITGIIGSAYWNRHTSSREEPEEQEAPPPPPPVPDPEYRAKRVDVVIPPLCLKVGTTADCYAYHRVDNVDNRCSSMEDLSRRYPEQNITKRFYPCKNCYPETTIGLTRGIRSRRARDNVPLVIG